MLPTRHSSKRARGEGLFLAIALLAALLSLWQLLLFMQDNSFLDGICAALGTRQLAPEARALRLFRWTSAYDDRLPPATATEAPPAYELLTPRVIVEHPSYFQADCGLKARLLATLAGRAGLDARDLRLCDASHTTRHVVCEVRIGGRWVVFDPTIGLIFRRRDGQLATAAELRDPALLAANVARAPAYDLRRWRFDHAERLHFEKLPLLGGLLRGLAPHLTGRPAEEIALPPIFRRPRVLVAGCAALLALLALAAAGETARRQRRDPAAYSLDRLPHRRELALEADQD